MEFFSTWTHHHLTAIRYARVAASESTAVIIQKLDAAVEQDLQAAIIVNRRFLREEHVNVWNNVRNTRSFFTFASPCKFKS